MMLLFVCVCKMQSKSESTEARSKQNEILKTHLRTRGWVCACVCSREEDESKRGREARKCLDSCRCPKWSAKIERGRVHGAACVRSGLREWGEEEQTRVPVRE